MPDFSTSEAVPSHVPSVIGASGGGSASAILPSNGRSTPGFGPTTLPDHTTSSARGITMTSSRLSSVDSLVKPPAVQVAEPTQAAGVSTISAAAGDDPASTQ